MAWPCISRVCCLARFWSQLDTSDLAVPLTIHSYSDIEEPEEAADGPRPRPRAGGQLPAGPPPSQDGLAVKRSWKGGSQKRGQAAASPPFAAETQYRRDFRAWPLQKRDPCPWASDCGRDGAAARPGPARSVYVLPAGDREPRPEGSGLPGLPQSCPRSRPTPPPTDSVLCYLVVFRDRLPDRSDDGQFATINEDKPSDSKYLTTGDAESKRQEYRPWTGAKPSKPIKTKQGFIIPEDHFVQETSYKADFKIPEAQTKFSPNPSAVFQAPSRILNV